MHYRPRAGTILARTLPGSPILLGVVAAMAILAAGCGSSIASRSKLPTSTPAGTAAADTAGVPDTPAGAQIRWLLRAAPHLPIPDAEIGSHFDTAFLAQVSPASLNQSVQAAGAMLPGSGPVRLASIESDHPRRLVAIVSRVGGPPRLTVTLIVDPHGLISGLTLKPFVPETPTTWTAVDAAVRSAAPQVRMLVADTTGGKCRPVHTIDAAAPAPLGSAFKLYVLDALANAIAKGKISWNQRLTVTSQVKSLGSGRLQNAPNGTRVSVRDTAADMISLSDNTAADMLIHLLGRSAIESSLSRAGLAEPARDRPFLTTRELFILKLDHWPALARRYVAADDAGRRALLARIDHMPLPGLAAARHWIQPRDIDRIEWFASAEDICRVYTSLATLARRPELAPIADILAINDGGLGLDPAEWRSTWFKGGNEAGVLNLTYRAATPTGRSYVVVALAEDPSAPIDEGSASPSLLSAIKGAFSLAARG